MLVFEDSTSHCWEGDKVLKTGQRLSHDTAVVVSAPFPYTYNSASQTRTRRVTLGNCADVFREDNGQPAEVVGETGHQRHLHTTDNCSLTGRDGSRYDLRGDQFPGHI